MNRLEELQILRSSVLIQLANEVEACSLLWSDYAEKRFLELVLLQEQIKNYSPPTNITPIK